jgi:hypothetical protein
MSQRNFDFVGWTKTALQNRRFTDADAMIRELTDLFDNVTFDERQSVFQNWIERLKSVIRHNGECFIKWLINLPLGPSSSRNRRGDITCCTPYIRIHIQIHFNIPVDIHICLHLHIWIDVPVHVHVHVPVHIDIHIGIHVDIDIDITSTSHRHHIDIDIGIDIHI